MSTEKLIPWTQFAADQRKAASRVAPLDIIEPIAWQGQDIPPRRWLVEPLIPEGAVSALYGNGGEGKSIVALQLLIAAALGRDWLGLPVRRCKALGIFCEDEPEELHRRVSAILKFYDAEPGDLEGLRLVSRVGTMNAMLEYPDRWNPGEETAFFGQVMNQALEFGAELVVLERFLT